MVLLYSFGVSNKKNNNTYIAAHTCSGDFNSGTVVFLVSVKKISASFATHTVSSYIIVDLCCTVLQRDDKCLLLPRMNVSNSLLIVIHRTV